MTLRNTMVQLVDYRDLEEIITDNKKFACSDIDMIYERNGKFLVGEWKKKGEEISKGQGILLNALANTPNFLVLLITGYSYETQLVVQKIQLFDKNGEFITKYEYDDLYEDKLEDGVKVLKDIIKSWYQWADNVQK